MRPATGNCTDWAEPLLQARKSLATAEACCTLQLWDQARNALTSCDGSLREVASAILLLESEHMRIRYEQQGWKLYRLKDVDAVARPGVCPYCGTRGNEHAEGCAMYCQV